MMTVPRTLLALCLCLSFGRAAAADEPRDDSTPPPVPLTREDLKQALENSKRATPRLPLPPLTAEEKARAAEEGKDGGSSSLGGGIVNNGRMRNHYLSEYGYGDRRRSRRNREPDPKMTLGYPFQTSLFWIVSRGNNCTYCLGHQEVKLASTGMTDDQIAALDGNWQGLDEAKRAAYAFTKTLSFAPHTLSDADIEALRAHYTDDQITEIILSVARFNATNRWTGSLRIPQEKHREYLTPTSSRYADFSSQVAPVALDVRGTGFAPPSSRPRPALESRAEVEAALKVARRRTPRLALSDIEETLALLNETPDADKAPEQWVRLLAVFPKEGPERIASHRAAIERGRLDARTKAIIAWVAARNDRAWYALGHAKERLRALGQSDDEIFALDTPEKLASPADREVARFARKLTVAPALISDEDVARLRELFEDQVVAEIVYQITEAAFFDRLTEAAGLQLESDSTSS